MSPVLARSGGLMPCGNWSAIEAQADMRSCRVATWSGTWLPTLAALAQTASNTLAARVCDTIELSRPSPRRGRRPQKGEIAAVVGAENLPRIELGIAALGRDLRRL